MFERFTERAKKAMELARQEALHLECECLGTEHILLGLLMEGSGLSTSARPGWRTVAMWAPSICCCA